MVKLAVAGGTGTAGGMVVAESVRRSFETRALSRRNPSADDPIRVPDAQYFRADVGSGQGLAEALAGVDVLIETLDGKSRTALKAMPDTTRTLLRAAEAAGVRRAVLLSIVNSDQSDYGYYKIQAQRAALYGQARLETPEQWKRVRSRRGLIVPLPLPGSFGAFLRAGKNLVPEHAYGRVTFRQWLQSR